MEQVYFELSGAVFGELLEEVSPQPTPANATTAATIIVAIHFFIFHLDLQSVFLVRKRTPAPPPRVYRWARGRPLGEPAHQAFAQARC